MRTVLAAVAQVPDAKALLELVDRLKGRLGEAAILLGAAADGRVHLVAERRSRAGRARREGGRVVKAAAEVVGGGGGGRDTMAQAGGRDPEKLDQAIAAGLRRDRGGPRG